MGHCQGCPRSLAARLEGELPIFSAPDQEELEQSVGPSTGWWIVPGTRDGKAVRRGQSRREEFWGLCGNGSMCGHFAVLGADESHLLIGWPEFNGEYINCPRLRKEWWAY